jgi:3-oxoacyl-[acyl-carrier-protein] synthase III
MAIAITGLGAFVPEIRVKNSDFLNHFFLDEKGNSIGYSPEEILQKFEAITGIKERRYAPDHQSTAGMGYEAAKLAIENAGIDPEELDYIVFAHNFGEVNKISHQSDMLPSLAARIKHQLKIKNNRCVAYDLIFGCPGWLEGLIQCSAFMKANLAKKCLIIGAETLSRVVDPFDRDSMIYSDGAGACVLEETNTGGEILSHLSASYTVEESNYLYFGTSNNKQLDDNHGYIKMHGRKIYEFALSQVPLAMKACLDESGISIQEVKKILIHQANEKMDEAIVNRFYKLYGMRMPEHIMPMNIQLLGNSSVATLPTLFYSILNHKIENHSLNKGDVIILASVGAGMNINALVYRI